MLCMLWIFGSVSAAHLKEVIPITNKIIMLKFVDGYIDHHNLGQKRLDDRVILFEGGRLNADAAKNRTSYGLYCAEDSYYSSLKQPVGVGYNLRIEQSWDMDHYGRPSDVQTTQIYLMLPKAMEPGKTYTIDTGSLASNRDGMDMYFGYRAQRSEAVHVNQLGYVPSAGLKFGYVYTWMGTEGGLDLKNERHFDDSVGSKFSIVRVSDGAVRYTGQVAFRKSATNKEFANVGTLNNNFTGSDVYECDFSSFNEEGTYKLVVDGIGHSFPFDIASNIYVEPFYWLMKSLYENRSGIELKKPYAQYDRPVCHRPGVNPGFKIQYSTFTVDQLSVMDGGGSDRAPIEAERLGEIDLWGWYQDAGDWDSYFMHQKIPLYLMALYELNPDAMEAFRLDIPESAGEPEGTALPDVLDEARWLVRYNYRMRHELMNKGFGTGGVGGGRVFGDLWNKELSAEDGKGSWQDQRTWYCLGEEVWSTYKYVAQAANFAKLLKKYGHQDPEGIDWQKEALEAWDWAQAKQLPSDEGPKLGHRLNLAVQRLCASAALYRLTGDQQAFESIFLHDFDNVPLKNDRVGLWGLGEMSEQDDLFLALSTYYKACYELGNTSTAIYTEVVEMFKKTANFKLSPTAFPQATAKRAMRWGGNWWMPLGYGQGTTPYIQDSVISRQIFSEDDRALADVWLNYSYTTADYFLGNNPLNMTMISGLGDRSPEQVFHMDSWYLHDFDGPTKKGIIPYGALQHIYSDVNGAGGYPGPYKYYYGLKKSIPFDEIGADGKSVEVRPGHERFMPSRTAPLVNEFTVHQGGVVGALVYGSLAFGVEALKKDDQPVGPVPSHRWSMNGSGEDDLGDLDLVLKNGASFSGEAQEGSASLDLSHSNSAAATVGQVDLGNSFSLTLWANNFGQQKHQNFLFCNGLTSNFGFQWYINSYGGTDGKLTAVFSGSDARVFLSSPAQAVSFGEWHHLALTVGQGMAHLYLDGVLVSSGFIPAGVDFNRVLCLGHMNQNNYWNTFNGLFDDAKVFSKTLTAEDVIADMSGKSGVAEPQPQYRYLKLNFEEGKSVSIQEAKWMANGISYPRAAVSTSNWTNAYGEFVASYQLHWGDYKLYDHQNNSSGNHLYVGNNLPHEAVLDLGEGNDIAPESLTIYKSSNGWSKLVDFSCWGSSNGVNWSLIRRFSNLDDADFPNNTGTFSLTD